MREDDSLTFVSTSCKDARCVVCGKPAAKKVEEVIFIDDPMPYRKPHSSFLCLEHFEVVMDLDR